MGGMTQYLDLPSWVAAEMIWALLPWVWWALRRTMLRGANPWPALVARLPAGERGLRLRHDHAGRRAPRLPARLRARAATGGRAAPGAGRRRAARAGGRHGLPARRPDRLGDRPATRGVGGFGGKFTTDPLALLASVLPTAAVPGTTSHLLPYAYLAWFLPAALWLDWGRARREWRPLGGLPGVHVGRRWSSSTARPRWDPCGGRCACSPSSSKALVVLLVVAWPRFGARPPASPRALVSLGWVGDRRWPRAGARAVDVGGPPVRDRAGRRAPCAGLVAGPQRAARLARTRRRSRDPGGVRAPARVLPRPALAAAQRPDRPIGVPGAAARTRSATCSRSARRT